MKPHQATKDFEAALCAYTGAPYAVAVNSCTMALLLAVKWHLRNPDDIGTEGGSLRSQSVDQSAEYLKAWRCAIEIPKRTYVSVPQSIIHAGGRPVFRDEEWIGMYRLKPLRVYDCARMFTSGMFSQARYKGTSMETPPGKMMCFSFHCSKILGDTQGGAILHDNPEADAWFRRARFDGRTEGVAPKDDHFDMIGYHCYMSPDVATRLLWKLSVLPKHNDPIPNDDYPDLSQMEIFK